MAQSSKGLAQIAVVAWFVATSFGCALASAQDVGGRFGSFAVVEGDPLALRLEGDINATTALEFRRAIRARPDTRLLLLNSPGGLVDVALIVAHEVHDRGVSTIVEQGDGCYSACAYVFFAGENRIVEGDLGVHQLWNEANDLISGQALLSDVLEALNEFEVSQEVVSLMLRTRPEDIHVFTNDELSLYDINKGERPLVREISVEDAPAPEPAPLPNNLRDLGPENVTVVPKTTSAEDAGLGRSERIVSIRENGPIGETLLKSGFTAPMVEMVSVVLRGVLPSVTMPEGARLRILFGPSRSSDSLIPYRLSIYFPDPSGALKHAATAALTDRGSYVLGLAPTPIEVGGEWLGDANERRATPEAPGQPFKQDRARPQHKTGDSLQ